MDTDAITALNILDPAGLANASAREQRRFLEHLSLRALTRVIQRISQNLDEAGRAQFKSLFLENASENERIQFLSKHTPNFLDLLIEETLKFKQEALEEIEKNKIGQE